MLRNRAEVLYCFSRDLGPTLTKEVSIEAESPPKDLIKANSKVRT